MVWIIALWVIFIAIAYEAYHSRHYVSRISGHSMTQYGIVEGDLTTVYVNREPVVGDMMNFRCTDYRKCPTHDMVKLVKDINEEGCYFVEGNQEPWYDIITSQYRTSLDSRIYGWLCKNDIKINGVVEKNGDNTPRESFINAKCVPPTREDSIHEEGGQGA